MNRLAQGLAARRFWVWLWLLYLPTLLARSSAQTPQQNKVHVVSDCKLAVWGCAPTGDSGHLELTKTLAHIRAKLSQPVVWSEQDLATWLSTLRQQAAHLSERAEATTLVARLLAEMADCKDGYDLFLKQLAEDRASAGAVPTSGSVLGFADRRALALGVAWCDWFAGRTDLAFSRYARLLQTDPDDPRVLVRLGDAWQAAGFPSEAARHYERVCFELPQGQPLAYLARGCAGLLVALDRTRHKWPVRAIGNLRRFDTSARYLTMRDYLHEKERDYYRAILRPAGCETESLLRRYVQDAKNVPIAYVRRAQEHLEQARAQRPDCAGASASPL